MDILEVGDFVARKLVCELMNLENQELVVCFLFLGCRGEAVYPELWTCHFQPQASGAAKTYQPSLTPRAPIPH